MRSSTGHDYGLTVIDGDDFEAQVAPGAIYVHSGVFTAGDLELREGEGAELTGSTLVYGSGIAGIASSFRQSTDPGPAIMRDTVVNEKPWGRELEVPTEAQLIQLKLIEVDAGHRTSLQRHERKDEIMMHVSEWCCDTVVHMLPGTEHRVAGPHRYFEASTYAPDDVVRLADDYGR